MPQRFFVTDSDCVESPALERVADDVAGTLKERGERYGEFPDHARITQAIKTAMRNSLNWADLSDDKKECLEMVAHKIGRILNGDPEYHDSWHDIEGYVRLVSDELVSDEPVPAGTQNP